VVLGPQASTRPDFPASDRGSPRSTIPSHARARSRRICWRSSGLPGLIGGSWAGREIIRPAGGRSAGHYQHVVPRTSWRCPVSDAF